ncbi:hypothetical protein GCM10023107_88310 [Actinoplanes octamycinicus]|nr:hypothetical protein Aoc01nite_78660 [Actinoplanes octamycinicus]
MPSSAVISAAPVFSAVTVQVVSCLTATVAGSQAWVTVTGLAGRAPAAVLPAAAALRLFAATGALVVK